MEKEIFKPGNMLYPLPVVMVSCADEFGNNNIITVAWCGTICTNPPMVSVSIRPERHSYSIIEKTKEFVINLTTEELTKATDFCGVRSGRDVDKFKEMNLTPKKGEKVKAPIIEESPVNIECRLKEIIKLGSHDMFIAEVVGVQVDKKAMNETGKFELNKTRPVVYSHGEYYGLGSLLGNFGYSVRKQKIQKVDKKQSKKPRGKINDEKR
ncbi:flavin reductase family protein [Lachnoclostridium phytofermentans]|uniref:Flavin reductase domain protein FMN-binding n=1 Tax=Lachnoclostridium phytofermentans (strain ATCC 700394 / DSM 18823 / ISDg) TaxID=357809 RepID=A9KL79_LACP7|nr:flavin reductase family protein [Lachnoclostridium phytofermentans]ABX44228.1 flavin reductase domain protein FMN-binding [Lachnoclostridium phytofermentans ISDg]